MVRNVDEMLASGTAEAECFRESHRDFAHVHHETLRRRLRTVVMTFDTPQSTERTVVLRLEARNRQRGRHVGGARCEIINNRTTQAS